MSRMGCVGRGFFSSFPMEPQDTIGCSEVPNQQSGPGFSVRIATSRSSDRSFPSFSTDRRDAFYSWVVPNAAASACTSNSDTRFSLSLGVPPVIGPTSVLANPSHPVTLPRCCDWSHRGNRCRESTWSQWQASHSPTQRSPN